ncbi:MAG TPA: nucleotidyltransferase domain-containing protein [Roseiflexaceae bacterium]|nr:nucleotidyltransferase domain-containing protein [Roseiflexaceae bacterium]
MIIDSRLRPIADAQPFPLLFATVSGAHLYGFPSPDSDYDLRGAHILPLRQALLLDPQPETIEASEERDGLELDLVTHDVKKFFALLLKRNGYVLEQLTSPLVVWALPEHERLLALVPQLLTRHHSHHYLGFAASQWRLFGQEQPPRVKPLLYVYRVLLTGIHLMRTGEIEANLVRLNDRFKLPYLPELIDRKLTGPEQGTLSDADLAFHRREYERLTAELETARQETRLPDAPSAQDELEELLVRLRMTYGNT